MKHMPFKSGKLLTPVSLSRTAKSLTLAAAVLCSGMYAAAQGIITGAISGTVVDASGAVIPGATVSAFDKVKGTTFKTVSQGDGNFNFPSLPVDTYTLTIASKGFATVKIDNLLVTTGNNSNVGKETLTAGDATQIDVQTSSLAELDTTQSQVSATFSTQQLESLPLNNGFDEVALLMPGVVSTGGANFANTNGTGLSSNGNRGRSNNFEIDGQSNNDNSISGPQVFFGNQDAIDQIQIVQTNFSAQYGRNAGDVVNYITKSGTNQIHGSAFELYTGSFLSSFPNQDKNPVLGFCASGQTPAANNCNPIGRLPRSVDNKWGGTIGFPIIKDKLFAFGSTYFEHTNNGPQPFNSGSQTTPTPAGLAQLAALYPNNAAVQTITNFGPYGVTVGNPQPVLSGATTESVIGPDGTSTNIQVAPVQRIAPSGNYTDQEDLGRLDWQATPKDRFYLRYLYQKTDSLNGYISNAGAAGGDFYDVPGATHSLGADVTHTFSPIWVDQLRYSFQQSKLLFQAGSYPNCLAGNFTACPGNISFLSNDLGFGEATNLPQGRTVKVNQVQNNATATIGKQTITFGGEFDGQNSPNIFLPNYNGSLSTGGLNTLVHETGTFNIVQGNPSLTFKENDYALFFQDDWKVSSDLTLNLGLRWEFFGQAINLLNQLSTARESNPKTAVWNTSLPLAQRTDTPISSAYKNYEPRIGFAYNPAFDRKFVIRGGYAINYDPAFYNVFSNASTLAPFAVSGSFACGGACLGSGDFTGAGLRNTNLSRLPTGGNPGFADQLYVPQNFHNPKTQTYSLGVEQQLTSAVLLRVGYVGTHGSGQFQSLDANPNLSFVQSAFPSAAPVTLCTTAGAPGVGRPNCNYGNQDVVGNTAFSIYNSLQSQLTLNQFHGFTGNLNYTWSHAIDNTSEIYSTGAAGNTISFAQNPLNTDVGERGTSGYSLPNVFTAGLTYTVPKIHADSSLLNKVVNGIQINTIYQYASGQPYQPYQFDQSILGLDPSYCDSAFNDSGNVGLGGLDACRLVLTNKNAPLNSIAILQNGASYEYGSYVQSAVFGSSAPPTPLATSAAHWTIDNFDIANQLGNPYPGSGRNILRGQTTNNVDASLFKDTQVTERVVIEFQLNAYNLANRQYRGTPNASAFADNAAVSVNPFLSNAYNTSNNRFFQFGGKIRF